MVNFVTVALVVLSLTHIQERNCENCNNLVYDTLTYRRFDYVYKPGQMVGVTFRDSRGTRREIQQHYIWCNPESAVDDPQKICAWTIDDTRRPFDNNMRGMLGFMSNASPSEFLGTSGCELKAVISPNTTDYTNFTCETISLSTREKTKMTYIFYLLSSESTFGQKPKFSSESSNHYAKKNTAAVFECKAYVANGIYSMSLNWYLMRDNGSLVNADNLVGHHTKGCVNNGNYWSLDLVVEKVTKDMFNSMYKCIISKVDLESPFSIIPRDLPLQAWNSRNPNVLITPQNSLYVGDFNRSDYPTAVGGCGDIKLCESETIFRLLEPKATEKSIALGFGLGVVGLLLLIALGISYHLYQRRPVVLSRIKHEWGITSEIVDPTYDYNISIFYSDVRSEEEEFLQNHLLVRLENTWKYKVHLLERDSRFGQGEADDRLSAIDASQKCLFLLTDDIFTDDWMLYALYSSLKHHEKVVIIKRSELDWAKIMSQLDEMTTQLKDNSSECNSNHALQTDEDTRTNTEGNEINGDAANNIVENNRNGGELADKNKEENVKVVQSPIESAIRVAKIVDWKNNSYPWEKLHYQLPLKMLANSKRHKLTSCIRSVMRKKNSPQNSQLEEHREAEDKDLV